MLGRVLGAGPLYPDHLDTILDIKAERCSQQPAAAHRAGLRPKQVSLGPGLGTLVRIPRIVGPCSAPRIVPLLYCPAQPPYSVSLTRLIADGGGRPSVPCILGPGISIAADVQTDNESLAQTDDSRTEAVGSGQRTGLGRLLEIMQKCS